MARPVRIANISGFYGDRAGAAREMLDGPIAVDVLTGDYLAELTMLILWKARRKDPSAGYATTFVRQMGDVLSDCLDRGIRVVANAGGLNPHGLADALRTLAGDGPATRIAVVDGDDLLPRLVDGRVEGVDLTNLDTGERLADRAVTPLTANAYLGGWGIAAALRAGADVVITSRVTDAALTLGPAAWWHDWDPTDWNELAGAVAAGHVIECGPQATGGNYSFRDELPDLRYPGHPIAEIAADGSSVITKQPGTGGVVSVGTVTAQLLYEIGEPGYANPDVVAHFDTARLEQTGPDRVAMTGVVGRPPTGDLKVAVNYSGGWRNTMAFVLTGLDIEAKAAHAATMLEDLLGGWDRFDQHQITLLRTDGARAERNEHAQAELRVTVKSTDRELVGRRFSQAFTELLVASYAGAYTTTPPSDATEFGVYWPALLPAELVDHRVTLPDGAVVHIPHSPPGPSEAPDVEAWPQRSPEERTAGQDVPFGTVVDARSGDKGGNANVGIWARDPQTASWLSRELTVDRFRSLLPEAAGLEIRRFEFANLWALNFVVIGLLGEGVASSVRTDPQAKGLGEYVRSRLIGVPEALLDGRRRSRTSEAKADETGRDA